MAIVARWNGEDIARSDDTIVVEGNHYFPDSDVTPGVLVPSDTVSVCPWKGTARYYSIHAGGSINEDAAWYYPDPKDAAAQIRHRVAFWKGVQVAEE